MVENRLVLELASLPGRIELLDALWESIVEKGMSYNRAPKARLSSKLMRIERRRRVQKVARGKRAARSLWITY